MNRSLVKHLQAVSHLSEKINQLNTVEEIAWTITEDIIAYLGFVDCVIYTLDHEKNLLHQVAAYGPKLAGTKKIKTPISIPLGKSIVGRVAQERRAEIVPDTTADLDYLVDEEKRASELAVPVIANGKVIAVIDSEHHQKNFYTEEDLHAVKAIANLTALQLNKALQKQQADSEITELKELLTLILDHSNSAILFESMDKKVLKTNKAFCNALEITTEPQELEGKSTLDLAEHFREIFKDKEAFVKRIQTLKKKNEAFINEEITLSNNRIFSRDFIPIKLNNKTVGYYWQYNDITQKVRSHQRTKRALESEKRYHNLNKNLVSIASHELRTPLTSIKSTIDLVLSNPDYFDKEQILQRLNRVQRATNTMSHLLNEIMTLGKLENFKAENAEQENLKAENVQSIIDEIGKDYMPERPLVIDNLVTDNEISISVFKNKLYLVLRNILSNADKYSQEHLPIKVSLEAADKALTIQIKDQGIGIPKPQLASIFDTFARGSNVKNTKGAGLGLAIVKRAMELMNGSVKIHSNPGEGTIVMLSFPTCNS